MKKKTHFDITLKTWWKVKVNKKTGSCQHPITGIAVTLNLHCVIQKLLQILATGISFRWPPIHCGANSKPPTDWKPICPAVCYPITHSSENTLSTVILCQSDTMDRCEYYTLWSDTTLVFSDKWVLVFWDNALSDKWAFRLLGFFWNNPPRSTPRPLTGSDRCMWACS